MNQFENLSVDAKVVYLLSLSELIIGKISQSKGYGLVVESLERGWQWVKYRNIEASSLYLYLENMDDASIMTYMQFENDNQREKVWICYGNALAYIIWEAYQYEEEKYLPQTIESVDFETVESFVTNFNEVFENKSLPVKLLHFLEENYPKGTSKHVDRNLIKTFINGCMEE
ncbi:Imm6 family immunity protein [Metabacillus sp. FJAT-52054]|uniref:Imm6 family immunity protein n=1 Tax=Metabacillus sediminis TaxID=3117746 RepID=A0ABZ2NKG0_9BACI